MGVIPPTVAAVRIIPLSHSAGELFLEGWFLCKEWPLARGDFAEVDGFPVSREINTASLPSPSTAEISAAEEIGKQIEEKLMSDERMFDFSEYLSGYPPSWFGGEGYVESLYLMRRELGAASRLNQRLLELVRRQVGFDRIFLERSFRNAVHPGDLGEDCDYTRITSERLIYLSLFEPDPKLRTHFTYTPSNAISAALSSPMHREQTTHSNRMVPSTITTA